MQPVVCLQSKPDVTIGIGGNDLLVAAHALAVSATVVTANMEEFKRIRGLKLENWLA